MPFRADVVGGAENPLDPIRHIQGFEATRLRQLFHQFFGVEPFPPGHRLEVGIDFHQTGIVHDVSDVAEGKQRLDATGGPGNNADRARGGNGGWGRIAHGPRLPEGTGSTVGTALPRREGASYLGKLTGC